MNTLRVKVEPQPGASVSDAAGILRDQIKGNVGVTADIEIAETGALPRSQGKAQRIVNL